MRKRIAQRLRCWWLAHQARQTAADIHRIEHEREHAAHVLDHLIKRLTYLRSELWAAENPHFVLKRGPFLRADKGGTA